MDPDDIFIGAMGTLDTAVDVSSAYPIAGDSGTASGTGTGQYGMSLDAPPVAAIGGAAGAIWGWLNAPFRTPLSSVDVFLLVAVVMLAILAWNLILYHLRIAAESL